MSTAMAVLRTPERRWCISCGTKQRATTATVILRGDPYCIPCARVDGFSAEEITRGAKEFLATAKPEPIRSHRPLAKPPRRVKHVPQPEPEPVKEAPPEVEPVEPPDPEQAAPEPEEPMEAVAREAVIEMPPAQPGPMPELQEAPEPTATLVVTARQMEEMFHGLSLEHKARMLQEHLDKYR